MITRVCLLFVAAGNFAIVVLGGLSAPQLLLSVAISGALTVEGIADMARTKRDAA